MADAYEAMTADRVYRKAIGVEAAREELRRGAGSQFDADVVAAFLEVLEGPAGTRVSSPGSSAAPAPR